MEAGPSSATSRQQALLEARQHATSLQELVHLHLPASTRLHSLLDQAKQLLEQDCISAGIEYPHKPHAAQSAAPQGPPARPRSTFINPVQLLTHVQSSAPDAAALIASLIPLPIRKALTITCTGTRDIIRDTCTSLSIKASNPLPLKRDIGPDYPHVKTLELRYDVTSYHKPNHTPVNPNRASYSRPNPNPNPSTSANLISPPAAAIQHLTNTCPSLLSSITSLAIEDKILLDHWKDAGLCHALAKLLGSCSSLQTFEIFTPHSNDLRPGSGCSDAQRSHSTLLGLKLPAAPQDHASFREQLAAMYCATLDDLWSSPLVLPCLTTFTLSADVLKAGRLSDIIAGLRCLQELRTGPGFKPKEASALAKQLAATPLLQLTAMDVAHGIRQAKELTEWVGAVHSHPQLKQLRVFSWQFSPALQLTQLTTLEMTAPPHVLTEGGYSAISRLVSLRELLLSNLECITPEFVQLLQGLTPLQHFTSLTVAFTQKPAAARKLQCSVAALESVGQGGIQLPFLQVIAFKGIAMRSLAQLPEAARTCCEVILTSITAPRLTQLEGELGAFCMPSLSNMFPSLHPLNCPQLHLYMRGDFDLYRMAESSPELFRHHSLFCHGLRHFEFENFLRNPASQARELLHLDLSQSTKITYVNDATLAAIAAAIPMLRTLGLAAASGNHFTSGGIKSATFRLPHLQHVHLVGCKDVENDCMAGFADSGLCRTLTYLNLDGLEGVSEEALLELGKVGGKGVEKKFVIRGRHQLTAVGIQKLMWKGWSLDF